MAFKLFTPFSWRNKGESPNTPLNKEDLQSAETGIAEYAKTVTEELETKTQSEVTAVKGEIVTAETKGTSAITAIKESFATKFLKVEGRAEVVNPASSAEHSLSVSYAKEEQALGAGKGSAINVSSENKKGSTVQISGVQNETGVVKIAHTNKSTTATGDKESFAISVDLKKGAEAGTEAGGIFLTSTDGTNTGAWFTVRNSSSEIMYRLLAPGGMEVRELGSNPGTPETSCSTLFVKAKELFLKTGASEEVNRVVTFGPKEKELKVGSSVSKMGFFGATVAEQPKTTGTTLTFTLGKTGAPTEAIVKENFEKSTFTGNKGATAYTIGDIVLALKQLGFLKE